MRVKYKLITSNIYREFPSKLKYLLRVSFIYQHQPCCRQKEFNYSIKRPALSYKFCWLLRRVLTSWCALTLYDTNMSSSMGTDIIRRFRIYT